jgi:hypothetical protein
MKHDVRVEQVVSRVEVADGHRYMVKVLVDGVVGYVAVDDCVFRGHVEVVGVSNDLQWLYVLEGGRNESLLLTQAVHGAAEQAVKQAREVVPKAVVEASVLEQLCAALTPLVEIADEYDRDGLDECRPEWDRRGVRQYDPSCILYEGRGGKVLLRLRDVMHARGVLRKFGK